MCNKNILTYAPSGWFCVGFSKDLPPKGVYSTRVNGLNIVVYRTESGKVAALDGYCPHMGASLGVGGIVEGDTIRCPFHGICLNTAGQCVKTSYAASKEAHISKLNAYTWPIIEKKGGIFVYYAHDRREPPEWQLPQEVIQMQYSPCFHQWELAAHPQEIAENGADVGHFKIVHLYDSIIEETPLETQGVYLHAHYKATIKLSALRFREKVFTLDYDIHQYGLGYAHVIANIIEIGLKSDAFVFPTLLHKKHLILRVGFWFEKIQNPGKLHGSLYFFPKFIGNLIARRIAFAEYKRNVQQDLVIWENKTYVNPARLIPGDGPIAQYREWAKQFQPPK